MRAVYKCLTYTFFCFSMSLYSKALCQQLCTLHIHHPSMPWHVSDSVVIEVWKYYLCNLSFGNATSDACILVESDTLLQLTCTDAAQKHLTFSFGVDSLKQTQPNYSGDLNPLKNMYWTWQSGYIQLKAEGKVCRNNGIWEDFQLHLGGFRHHRTDRFIQQFLTDENIELNWHEKRLSQILQLNPRLHIMSECAESSQLMSQIANCIQIQ